MSTTTIQNETFTNLLAELKLDNYTPSLNTQSLLNTESKYIKDLKINVSNVISNTQYLNKKEALLLALAVAANEKNVELKNSFATLATEAGATEAEIAETFACTSLMNTNNVFYRFRHFMHKEKEAYDTMQAGIKMSIMLNPILGKEFFELMSLVVSTLNGCEMCVTSHEKSVLQQGGSEPRVFEAVKLAAIIKGLIAVL
ncbi:MAG TPA: carboxymuconolactone decarboxylase family protein [Ferruginibacter sp.]|nr:carboxymuconolactone decarboxylase family protein [Ferruginibacter sp.]